MPPPSRPSARPNLQSLLDNATRDLPGMTRFATEITARLPLRLDPNLDLDSFVDSSWEALWALHEFINKPSNGRMGVHRLSFLSKILDHVAACLQLYMDRVLVPGDVSRYPRDCYRISILVLFDFVDIQPSGEEIMGRLVRLRCATQNCSFVGSIIPDLFFQLTPSVSYTTDSSNVFYELTSVLYTIVQHGPLDSQRPWSDEILSRLICKPSHVVSFIERSILQAFQTLSVAATETDFYPSLSQLTTAYCTIRRLSVADDCFSPYAFSPASRRRVLQVLWKVSNSKFTARSSKTSRAMQAADRIIQCGVEVGKFVYRAVQVVGREMVREALRHRVLESFFLLRTVLDGAAATILSPSEVANLEKDLLEAMLPYFIYPSVRRIGLRCRNQMEATAGYRVASTWATLGPAILPWPQPCMHGSSTRLHGSTAIAQMDSSSKSSSVPTFEQTMPCTVNACSQ